MKSMIKSFIRIRNLQINTVIDVGANEGQFASYISKIFPKATIHCFEPLPEVFEKLSRWGKSKNDKIKTYNVALGDFEGEIEMFYHTEHSPSSSILKTTEICESIYPFTKSQKIVKVKQMTLDKAVDTFNIPLNPEILIKLDVQGYEDRVIKGGEKTFKKAKVCIVEVNLYELYKGQPNFKEISDLLYSLGFKYVGNLDQAYENDGRVVYIDAVFISKNKLNRVENEIKTICS